MLASGTLARQTDVMDRVRGVLGNKLAGVCTKIGAHTPRIDVVAAANAAREAGADALLTVGGGSVTDAAKMVGLCLGNDVSDPEQLDNFRARSCRWPHRAPTREAAGTAFDRRAHHTFGRRVQFSGWLHRYRAAGEGELSAIR